MTVSGLRSSWLALATKRRCASTAASRRSSISSSVSRQLAQLVARAGQRDALVQALLGDPARGVGDRAAAAPARGRPTTQPTAIASSAVPASAIPYWASSRP